MASGSNNLTSYKAKQIIGSSIAASPSGALLLTGEHYTGNTWLYHYGYGGTTNPWGIFHNTTAEKLIIKGSGTDSFWIKMNTGDTYVLGKMGIGYDPNTTGNNYKLYVNGSAYFNIGTSDNTTDLKFVINGNGRYLALGAGGVQARTSADAVTTLYLNFNGGTTYVGGNSYLVGSVGIGYNPDTSGNTYKLYVNGSTNITGTTTLGDYLYRAYTASGQTPMIWMNSSDFDNYLWQIGSGTANGKQYYGYGLKYTGTGSGVANYLQLIADNQNGTDVVAIGVNQSGQIGLGANANTNYRLYVSGTTWLNDHLYLAAGKHIYMNYNSTDYSVIHNHNNGNISVEAASGGLYIGYANTTLVNWMNGRMELRDGCLSLFPNNGSYREGIRIHATGSWSDITLCGNDNTGNSGTSANSWFIGNNNGIFYITHNGSSSSSTGYLKASTENSAGYWQLYQRVGVNGISNAYNFYVNGTSYFNGNILLKANQYRADNGGINANNSDIINVNSISFNDVADTFNEGIMFYRNGSAWECIAANSSGFFFRGGTDGSPALSAANANGTIFASVVWGEKVRVCSNWVGFYAAAGDTTTRYGYIQANADRMYFRKENGTSTYAFDFNGYIYTSGKLHVASQEDVGLNQNGAVVIGNKGGTNIGIDDNEIMARNNSAASTLYINSEGGQVYIGGGGIYSGGNVVLAAGKRISGNGGALYVGNSDNANWLYVQDIASQNGNDKWKITVAGAATFASSLTLTGGSISVQQGHVWAGTNGNTSGERQVGCQSGAGKLYMYSQAATTANRGIYGANNAGTSASYFYIQQDNYVRAGTRLYGAVWNDYAEFRLGQMNGLKPGQIVTENGDGTMRLASERLQKGCKVLSDTYGFALGETNEYKLPIAVSGRVLVYCDTPIEELEPGDCLCSNVTGNTVKMTREEIISYPDCIIGTVSEIPTYDIWHCGDQTNENGMKEEVQVNGRIWIYVK